MAAQNRDDADPPTGGAPPPDDFHKFLVGLATDPAKLGAFIKDPDAAMTAAGLPEADQAVLKSGHPGMIHDRLRGQTTQLMLVTPPPVTLLIVDMAAEGGHGAEQPTIRQLPQGGQPMYPNHPIYPPAHPIYPPALYPVSYPQVDSQSQIGPHPTIVHPVIVQAFPQFGRHALIVHPQIVQSQAVPQFGHPQIVHPQIVQSQAVPQFGHPLIVHPRVVPQFGTHPQIVHPQLVIYPQVGGGPGVGPWHPLLVHYPYLPTPVVYPNIYPLLIYPPPMIYYNIYPMLLIYSPYGRPAGV